MHAVTRWLRQPTTIAGLGAVGAFCTHLSQGGSIQHWLPVLVAGMIAIAMPDSTGSAPPGGKS